MNAHNDPAVIKAADDEPGKLMAEALDISNRIFELQQKSKRFAGAVLCLGEASQNMGAYMRRIGNS